MASTQKPIGVALIGCGRVSDAHLGAITSQPEKGRLVAVVDRNPELARAAAERFGAEHACASIDQAMKIPEVEAAIICLPNHLHGEASIQCLNAGRHVLVEKPMADDYATTVAMGEAAEAAGKVLAVGQSRRHGSAIRYVQDHLESFGELRAIQASFCMYWDGPQAPWWAERTAKDGLVLSLLGSHTIDFVQMMLGKHPLRVHAEATRLRDCWSAEDEAMILIRYPQNKMATVHLSYNQQPFFERYHLLFDTSIVEVRDVNMVLVNNEVVHAPAEEATLLVTNELFKNQFAEFAAACHGLPNRSALHPHGIALMRVIDAALESSLANQTVAMRW
ncbi:Gfo/Idh/MocA family oxidoreductase [Amycolatopsis acidicola]|uniref:Gfo/Idh/MocA family oxidoreductase n=1 Tax=Amycolatopsis acidicola TaxID=2596893 RepID=A0A5N0VFU8_9PSEU|nr:Gfo/Idh/MocA family oxidoreductase [Amycolatopsis acidicola]KAA9164010.1 Gfo/Idh/MocA family oxidoreductase [Amycolatopsis acidicola]